MHFRLKTHSPRRADLGDFAARFNASNRHDPEDVGADDRRRSFGYEELLKRDKPNLDIFSLKDKTLEDSQNLPEPDVLTQEIVDLQTAPRPFAAIAAELGAADMPDPKGNPLNLMTPLSEDELDELQAFLISDAVSDETMLVDQLDGFLTAIVIGPTTIMPSRWLPRIRGSSPDDAPEFKSGDQAQRVMTLIMRHMNGIIASVGGNPEDFDPMFVTGGYEGDPGEYLDGEMWGHGFMRGIELSRGDWRPLLDDPDGARS